MMKRKKSVLGKKIIGGIAKKWQKGMQTQHVHFLLISPDSLLQ